MLSTLTVTARRAASLARLTKTAHRPGNRALSSLYGGSDKERAEELAYFRKQEQVGRGTPSPFAFFSPSVVPRYEYLFRFSSFS